MNQPFLPMTDETYFEEVSHQGKTIKVGDRVVIQHAGERREVLVSGILRKENHYWVGYEANKQFCPWPLVQLVKRGIS